MTDRDRAWDAEHHRAALQIITEADRGLRVAEHELKGGRLMDARETVRIVRGLMPPLERAIQRRPVRAEEPVVRTVGDLTARHIGRQVIVDSLHAVLGTLPWLDPDGVWRVGLNGYGEVCSLDEPCEVLP